MVTSNTSDPFIRALRFLSHKDRTEAEVAKKLYSLRFSTDEVDDTIEKLKKQGYLNDEEYCRKWISYRQRHNPVGKLFALKKLRSLGIDEAVIEKQLDALILPDEELKSAIELLDKRSCRERLLDDDEKGKQFRFLMGRGFSRSVALKALDKYCKEYKL